jgi:hypothetical protein
LENKKVRNAEKIIYEDISFDSKLEVYCYKRLLQEGFNPTYGGIGFDLIPSFILHKVEAYYPNASGKNTKTMNLHKNHQGKKYTPDFILQIDRTLVVIETKGNPNDDYPTKRKLFLKKMEDEESEYNRIVFLEPHNQRQINECIDFIKTIRNDTMQS